MSKLRAPYQCLKQCGNYLVAARGSSIDTFDIKDGSYLSTWKSPVPESTNALKAAGEEAQTKSEEKKPEASTPDAPLESSTPPAKRRKVSVSEEKEEKTVVVQQLKKKAKNTAPKIIEPSPITALAITQDLQHVIAVTGEDKTIRVLAWEDTVGKELKQISDRTMPKRPCALATTDDCSTIISADKFGDVYSLPLIPSPSVPSAKEDVSTEKQAPKKFQPSASALTVHSVRNLKALEAQKKQTNKVSEKTGPDFEHKLLLGHVSMLTDILAASVSGRHYILTADRDEHIRVSRGIPQSHVIEGFCLGHIEYVSRLCIPSTRPETLISGGGDDDLHVWSWLNESLLSKVNLKSEVEAFGPETTKDEPEADVPAAFIYTLTPSNQLIHTQTITLPGNALSCTLSNPTPSSSFSLIISIDNIHESGSITAVKDINSPVASPLQFFKYENEKFVNVQLEGFKSQDSEGILDEEKKNKLGSLLYNVGNLRKMEDEE
ncbi:hypothetical protein ACHAP3_009681 [Botrytis cinerea]